ncbi:MAG TPA: helix-turn-helix domain-containing protein [Petrimonas sp.]|uniref:helix-turn-helix domain-containing protein n=1 Tax=Petrimonas sp. TaxID=2023866 RepID=UPI00096431DF|nr:MAG: DNA-binding protein [Bacteroidia bacterium 43-41]HHV85652.1 helix-turn-helix domain-containing protein [Petrimonas sp.]
MNNRFSDNETGGLITKKTPQIIEFFTSLDRMLDGLEQMSEGYRPLLNGERYLTDKELAERLKVSQRVLYEYRQNGKIPYYQIGAKILYKESDVEKMLESHYRKAYR